MGRIDEKYVTYARLGLVQRGFNCSSCQFLNALAGLGHRANRPRLKRFPNQILMSGQVARRLATLAALAESF